MKRVLALALCLVMAVGLLPQMAAGAEKYTLTFEYPSEMCDVFATAANTDDPVYRTGDSVDAGTYLAYRIEDIAEGYRIKSVTMNGQDRTSGFVNGAYGSMATALNADTTVQVELERIPETLPSVQSVTVYLDQKLTQPADAYTTVDADTRFYGKASYSDGVTYPAYFVGGVWEYSVDGVNWIQDTAWGVHSFNYWPGWSHRVNFDPETHDLLVNGSYDLRMRVTVREGYSTGEDVLSNVIHVNGGAAVEIVDEGTCGEQVTWKLDAAGTLTISGEGEMRLTSSDWAEYSQQIKCVVIEDGVTSICQNAFVNCGSLISVSIADSVTEIGDSAFYGCVGLTDLVIPNSVTTIKFGAFADCYGLKKVTLPNRLTVLNAVFVNCVSLEEAVIPDSVTTIGAAFAGCIGLKRVTVGDGVTEISADAFGGCTALEQVTLGANVTTIRTNAFFDCEALTEVVFSEGLTVIETRAFSDCDSLREVHLPKSVTTIGKSAFWLCDALEKITVAEENLHYSSVDGMLFDKNRTALIFCPPGIQTKSVTLPDGLEEILPRAMADCGALREVTIPSSVTTIGVNAFEGCNALTIVHYSGSMEEWMGLTEGVDSGLWDMVTIHCAGDTAVFGTCGDDVIWNLSETGVLTISGSGAMDMYNGYRNFAPWMKFAEEICKVVIEDGVTEIGSSAFENCTALTEVSIPSSVTWIGEDAFRECDALCEVTIPRGVQEMGDGVFDGCDRLAQVTLSEGLYVVGAYVFNDCKSLTELVIPDSVRYVSESAFQSCVKLERVTVGANVEVLGYGLFNQCMALKKVELPAGLLGIDEWAFGSCKKLTDVYYRGTEAEWENILVFESGNAALLNARIWFETEMPDELLGDINHDENVDVSDAVLLFQYSMLPDLYPIEYVGSVDFNKDGVVDVSDAVLLFQYSMLPEVYPIG